MNKRSAHRSGQALLLLGSLLITALIVSVSLTSCVQQNNNTQGEDVPMTAEEILNVNAEIIRVEFEESGFTPKPRSLEGASRSVASSFSDVSDQRIMSIESELLKSGDIDLTVTDANGGVFVLFVGQWGSCDRIEDVDGNIVYLVVE